MVREILTDWNTPAGGGRVSVMYFDDTVSVVSQRAALATLWTTLEPRLGSTVTWTIRTEGRNLHTGNGQLLGQWEDTTSRTGTGNDAASTVIPDASQVLFRWRTGIVVKGRFLQGRTYVPGMTAASLTSGNVSAAARNEWNTAINTFLGANVGLEVWHRPVNQSGGTTGFVLTGSVWSELAVLRRRRS